MAPAPFDAEVRLLRPNPSHVRPKFRTNSGRPDPSRRAQIPAASPEGPQSRARPPDIYPRPAPLIPMQAELCSDPSPVESEPSLPNPGDIGRSKTPHVYLLSNDGPTSSNSAHVRPNLRRCRPRPCLPSSPRNRSKAAQSLGRIWTRASTGRSRREICEAHFADSKCVAGNAPNSARFQRMWHPRPCPKMPRRAPRMKRYAREDASSASRFGARESQQMQPTTPKASPQEKPRAKAFGARAASGTSFPVGPKSLQIVGPAPISDVPSGPGVARRG